MKRLIVITFLAHCCTSLWGMDLPTSSHEPAHRQDSLCYGCSICAMEDGREPSRCQLCCCTPDSRLNFLRNISRELGQVFCQYLFSHGEINQSERMSRKYTQRNLACCCCVLALLTGLTLLMVWPDNNPSLPTPTPLKMPCYFLNGQC